jgi:branched-chain amino acid transport system substrate-binding protein
MCCKEVIMAIRKKIGYLVICGILLAGTVIDCEAQGEKSPIKIAFLSDMTSAGLADICASLLEGCKMAVEDINATGGLLGRKLEILVADTKTDPTVTISQAKRLKANGIIAVVGSNNSSDVLALGKWSQEEGNIPIFPSYGGTNQLNGHPWVFRIFNMDVEEGSSLYLAKKMGKTKMGILHVNLAYGIDAARVIKKFAPDYGVQLVQTEGLDLRSTDATVQVTKLKNAGAEIVSLPGFADLVAAFVRALAILNYHPVYTSHTGSLVSGSNIAGPELLEGAIGRANVDFSRPDVQEIFKRYEKRTGKRRGDDPITNAYASVQMLAQAIKFAKTADDPVAIRDAVYKVKFENLLIGKKGQVFQFTPERNWLLNVDDYGYVVMKGGQFIPLKLN